MTQRVYPQRIQQRSLLDTSTKRIEFPTANARIRVTCGADCLWVAASYEKDIHSAGTFLMLRGREYHAQVCTDAILANAMWAVSLRRGFANWSKRLTRLSAARSSTCIPLLTAAVAGCGLGVVDLQTDEGAPPTQGAGPYGKLSARFETPADEPYVVAVFRVDVRDPAVLRRTDGGFRLWFGYEADPLADTSAIWTAEVAALTELPDMGPAPALVADQPWEEDWIGAPSIVTGSAEHLIMFYQGGHSNPGVGRADSYDGGTTWQKHTDNPVLHNAAEASVTRLPGTSQWLMYATRPGLQGIFRAQSPDGLTWTMDDEAVLLPRQQVPGAYDHVRVSDPFVVARRTEAGRVHYGLFFNGTDKEDENAIVSIGWAGSFDGLTWYRFANPDAPILDPAGNSTHAPVGLLEPDRGVLFFHERRQGLNRIAVALHP